METGDGAGARRLQEALRLYFDWRAQPSPEPTGALLERHPELRELLEPLLAGAPPHAPPTGTIGRFVLLRLLGQGGQGEVHLAEDTRLRRKVALKLLRGSRLMADTALRRFEREAAIASRLDHPAICTVLDVGREGDVPYIAMRYVEGETLARKIARAREAGGGAGLELPGGTPAWERTLALIEEVLEALHAAHEAGVIHRDVKPGNVMVTPAGRPVLLDFGLARALEGDEPTLTASGDLFGTPAYMSPEQLARNSAPLDRRTDVWSLGVTLYECLTLHRPFEAPTAHALARAIQEEDPPDPRRSDPRLPADLRVVLATALEKDRDRRYATARDLADELRRVRGREPIRARPAGALLRLRRWTARNRALSAALGGVLLALGGGLAVALVLLAGRSSALGVAETQRRRAERSLLQAEEAVERMLTRVSEERLAHLPQTEALRRQLLRDALELYQGFLREWPAEGAVRHQAAHAHHRVADLELMLGETAPAEEHYRRAIGLFEALRAGEPESEPVEGDLARAETNLGVLLRGAGRLDEAERSHRRALVLRQELAARHPDDPRLRREVAASANNLAEALWARGRAAEAREAWRVALDLHERLARERPDDLENRRHLVAALTNRGVQLAHDGDQAGAGAALRRAVELAGPLASASGAPPEHRALLAPALDALGRQLRATGRAAEAEAGFRKAIEEGRRLVADFPGMPDHHRALGRAWSALAEVLGATGRTGEAEESFREALAIQEKLASGRPAAGGPRADLLGTRINYGNLLATSRRLDEAEAQYRAAAALGEGLAAGGPDAVEARTRLAGALVNLGAVLERTGRGAAAEEPYRRTVGLWEELAAARPESGDCANGLAQALHNLGCLLRGRGELAGARELLERAVERERAALRTNPDEPRFRQDLRRHFAALAQVHERMEEPLRSAAAAEELARALPADGAALAEAAAILERCARMVERDAGLAARAGALAGRAAELREAARRAGAR
jgi:tetratricopeptide (TPR) repeat protein/tRNA A-37 threonylcarbamoyl transferase component Bud32